MECFKQKAHKQVIKDDEKMASETFLGSNI